MIKFLDSSFRTHLISGFPRDNRFYIDFRQLRYPALSGTEGTYSLITSADNQPGSHNLTGGTPEFLFPLPSTLTINIRARANFEHDTASNQPMKGWYVSATQYLIIQYNATDDRVEVVWYDGTAERKLQSDQFDDGTSHDDIDAWYDFTFALDLTTGTTAGSALYVDRTSQDTTWSGNIDTKSTNFPAMEVRGDGNGNAGDWLINQIRIFPNKVASASEIADDFKDVKDEEIVWHFNGIDLGQTRCNVTSRAGRFSLQRSIEGLLRRPVANSARFSLRSPAGQFADDQYAAFDPANEVYNGTSAQAYMQARCPVEVETWFSNSFELLIRGRLSDDKFSRRTPVGPQQTIQLQIMDGVEDLKRYAISEHVSYEDYTMCDPSSESTSLLHTLVRIVTKPSITNYVANSSFENTTISDSWTASGTGASLAKAAGGLFGSNEAQLASGGGGNASFYQDVTFTGDKLLNPREEYTYSIWIKSTAACSGTIKLAERDGSGENDSTSVAWSIGAGDNWELVEVTHTLTDSNSDRLRAEITLTTGSVTLSADGAMLIQDNRALNWFVLNNNDGASGVEGADDADSDSYDMVGFDADQVDITHPWAYIEQHSIVWDELKYLGDATLASYIGFDACGTFKYRSRMKTSYSDPSALLTVTPANNSVRSVVSALEPRQANRIEIYGPKITKTSHIEAAWDAKRSGHFDVGDDGNIEVALANGDQFPDPDVFGDYWAEYTIYRKS